MSRLRNSSVALPALHHRNMFPGCCVFARSSFLLSRVAQTHFLPQLSAALIVSVAREVRDLRMSRYRRCIYHGMELVCPLSFEPFISPQRGAKGGGGSFLQLHLILLLSPSFTTHSTAIRPVILDRPEQPRPLESAPHGQRVAKNSLTVRHKYRCYKLNMGHPPPPSSTFSSSHCVKMNIS